MSHIPASYDHFRRSYIFVKLDHFWSISRKSHFGRFVHMWHRRWKTINLREIICSQHFFLGNVYLGPGYGEFWFWSDYRVSKIFYNTLKSEISHISMIFCSILEFSKCCKYARFQILKCCKNCLNSVFDLKTKIPHTQEPNRHFPEKMLRKNYFP